MSRRPSRPDPSADDTTEDLPRTFTAILGLLAGTLIGLCVGVGILLMDADGPSVGRCAALGAGIGLVLGALSRTLGLGVFESLLHVLMGAQTAVRDDGSLPPPSGAGWLLRIAMWLGFLGAVALMLRFL